MSIKVTSWLESTKNGDIAIEKFVDKEWYHDRYMRTCTTSTGLQELVSYRKQNDAFDIRIVDEKGEILIIHSAYNKLLWC